MANRSQGNYNQQNPSQQSNFQYFTQQPGTVDKSKISQVPSGYRPPVQSNLQSHRPHEAEEEEEYNPLRIPCDWEVARKHAYARRTAPDLKKNPVSNSGNVETCPCCGYEMQRQDIEFCSDPTKTLSFLGSGFPLFYNFMRYCIILLFIQLLIKQLYNTYSNLIGDYCVQLQYEEVAGRRLSIPNCPNSFFLLASLANKLNNEADIHTCQMLNFVGLLVIMLVLLHFRSVQRKLDNEVDQEHITPADYTICVKNIPTGLDLDYKWELTNIFQNYAVLESDIELRVKKVVLVYDIEEIVEKEEELDKLIVEKKEKIKNLNYNYTHAEVKQIDEKIESVEHALNHIRSEYIETNKKFSGIAFISFDDEAMKDLVLKENTHTLTQRLCSFFNSGVTPDLTHEDLSWHHQKLFVEQAPEPNDVDWEFMHVSTKEKVFCRIRAWLLYIIFESATFFIIYLISLQLAIQTDKAHEQDLVGDIQPETMTKILVFSYAISLSIVLFNKFGVAKICHYIVDSEKISNKTSFQISFAHKYAVALFTNAAMISYVIDIIIQHNIIGYGGFIYNESLIFILNAFLPPFIWLLDPWYICKNFVRNRELKNKEKSVLTQQEANILMEQPDYLSAKRYSDIMKTMWFTFLYGEAIPLGTILSSVGIFIYYYIDYYNILRRRTVKESINKQLSTEMIEMLEMIIFWSAFGGMTMSFAFFGYFSTYDIALFIISILYQIIPMERVSECLFPTQNEEEPKPYDEGCLDFDTDYDRENPITKNEAIKAWNKYLKQKETQDPAVHQHHHAHHQVAMEDGGYRMMFANYH